MTPWAAYVATTRTAAELMGLDGELGTVEVGKRADFVVVTGDPADVAGLPTRIEAVYIDGARVPSLTWKRPGRSPGALISRSRVGYSPTMSVQASDSLSPASLNVSRTTSA